MNIQINELQNNDGPVTVQVFEDGCLIGCNHDGAEEDEVDFGFYEHEDWLMTLVCDKCNAILNKNGSWVE